MTDPTLTPDLELQIIRLQLEVKQIERDAKIKAERSKLRIAEEQSGKGWFYEPIQQFKLDPVGMAALNKRQQQVSDSRQVAQSGRVASEVRSAPATLYFWTLAMGFVLGLITGFLVWGR